MELLAPGAAEVTVDELNARRGLTDLALVVEISPVVSPWADARRSSESRPKVSSGCATTTSNRSSEPRVRSENM